MSALARLSVVSFIAAMLLLVGEQVLSNGWLSQQAHLAVLLVGCVLPALAAWHNHSYGVFTRSAPEALVNQQAGAYSLATVLLGLGILLQPSSILSIAVILGFLALLAAAVWSLRIHMACKPDASLVDEDAEPLTKGDDASFKHLKMAHFFFPVGVLFALIPYLPYLSTYAWAQGLRIGGLHLIGIGYGLLSLYGIGHLWVPRFSGVPAIAAGAIKGELHSTMPAMILLPIGFATGIKGFIIAGGAFAFLGFFTYMGVLGANIMRNKSPTHRVTPEFVYIPWTFTGIFWLVSAVVMGIFLNAVPDLLAKYSVGLKAAHVNVGLIGGFIQLMLGWTTRMGNGTPRFQGAMSLSFYGFNAGLVGILWGAFGGGQFVSLVSIGLVLLAILGYGRTMQGFIPAPRPGTDS